MIEQLAVVTWVSIKALLGNVSSDKSVIIIDQHLQVVEFSPYMTGPSALAAPSVEMSKLNGMRSTAAVSYCYRRPGR